MEVEFKNKSLKMNYVLTKNIKNRIQFSKKGVSLQRQTIKDDTPHPTPPSAAMGQKRIRVCTDIFQQPSAGLGFLSAYVHRVHVVLSDLELHLLFQ